AQSYYYHREIEGTETGTTFQNKGNETRIEGVNKGGDWHGVSGIQTQIFTFEAEGDEAFLPEAYNEKIAAFSYQDLHLGQHAVNFGARLEINRIEKKSSINFGNQDEKN